MSGRSRAADLLEGTIVLLRFGAGRCALVLILLMAAGAAAAQLQVGSDVTVGVDLMLAAAAVVGQCWLVRGALSDMDAPPPPRVRLGAFFLLWLLYSVATLLGLLLLVLPGLLVAARLWVGQPLLIDRDISPVEALAASWRETAGHERPLIVLVACFSLPPLGVVAAAIWDAHPEEPQAATLLLVDLVSYGCMILASLSSVAAYAGLRDRDARLFDVFS